jgi:hypothetical protein
VGATGAGRQMGAQGLCSMGPLGAHEPKPFTTEIPMAVTRTFRSSSPTPPAATDRAVTKVLEEPACASWLPSAST